MTALSPQFKLFREVRKIKALKHLECSVSVLEGETTEFRRGTVKNMPADSCSKTLKVKTSLKWRKFPKWSGLQFKYKSPTISVLKGQSKLEKPSET